MAARCQTGEAHDPTERCEGAAAIPVASETAADGASLRATPWTHCGRPPIRRQRSNDSALAGALATGSRAGPRAAIPAPPGPANHAAGRRTDQPGAPRARVWRPAHAALAPARPRGPGGSRDHPANLSGYRRATPAADPQAGAAPAEAL